MMTATLNEQTRRKKRPEPSEAKAAAELVRAAKEQGLSLTGPDGLLRQLTKTFLETALNEEMTEHLGYEKHESAGVESGNLRNGTRAKTVLTDASGPVQIDVPRDRAGTFVPVEPEGDTGSRSGVPAVHRCGAEPFVGRTLPAYLAVRACSGPRRGDLP